MLDYGYMQITVCYDRDHRILCGYSDNTSKTITVDSRYLEVLLTSFHNC